LQRLDITESIDDSERIPMLETAKGLVRQRAVRLDGVFGPEVGISDRLDGRGGL
jgi:hypothetical protein